MRSLKLLFFAFLFSTQAFSQSEGEESSTTQNSKKDVPFTIIENGPTYPGCVGAFKERKKCLDLSIRKFMVNNFDSSLIQKLDLPAGKFQFLISFRIKTSGYSETIKIKAPHPDIVKEIERVVSMIPKMKPATQRGKPVAIRYLIPLSFMVE
jgi:hypothetical protein